MNISPSAYVILTLNYRQWCTVSRCNLCGLKAKYEDCHLADPCPNCGRKLNRTVGRWIGPPWWAFWSTKLGYWEILEED